MAGYVVHDQIGEGNYSRDGRGDSKIDCAARSDFGIQPAAMPTSTVFIPQSVISGGLMSPETYFGSERRTYLANGTQGMTEIRRSRCPWSCSSINFISVATGILTTNMRQTTLRVPTITYKYTAGKIYFVAAAPKGVTVEVLAGRKAGDGCRGRRGRAGW